VKKRSFFSSKKFVSGTVATVIVALAIGLFFALNILSVKILDDTLKLTWDLTSTKKYSFTKESTKFLKSLKDNVTIYCLFDKNDKNSSKLSTYKNEIEFIEKYQDYSKVKVVFRDPEKYPNIISEVDPKSTQENLAYGDIIIKSKKRMKRLQVSSLTSQQQDQSTGETAVQFNVESLITNGINYVSKTKVPNAFFVTGHGEQSKDSEVKIFSQYVDVLGFESKTMDLLKDTPKKDDVIIIVSPKKDINETESDKLIKFIDEGGKVVSFFAPISNTKVLENFDKVLKECNLGLEYDVVKEKTKGSYADKESYPVPTVQEHASTSTLTTNKIQVVMTESRSILKLNDKKEGLSVTPILVTTDKAVGEPYDKAKQTIKGPLNLGVATENTNTGSKVLVLGNSQFITDELIQKTNGLAIIDGAFKWIGDSKDEIQIESKVPKAVQISLTKTQVILLNVAILVVIPLLILGTGVFIWLKRRHL